MEHWYENPLICHALIFGSKTWLKSLEVSLQEADIDNITNNSDIFGGLTGAKRAYDEQLFDAFAKVQI